MQQEITKVAVDAMGGDFAPESTVLGSLKAVKDFKDIELTLYGDENKIYTKYNISTKYRQ